MAKKIRKRRANYFDGGGFSWQKGAGFGENMGNAFSGGALNGAIGAASSMVGQGISGGLSSGAGNAIQELSNIASAIPGPWGAIAGAGLNIVGGLVNRAFGSQINEQAVQEAKAENANVGNQNFAFSNTSDVLSTNIQQLGAISQSEIGKDGWFSDKAKNLARELNRTREIANAQGLNNFVTAVDNLNTNNANNATYNYAAYGGPITMRYTGTMSPFGNTFSKGGKIHIKPENRGKFTALKKRTGKSATWFKEHGTPAQRKMATFALNARKWKHAYGGDLYDTYYYPSDNVIDYIRNIEKFSPTIYRNREDNPTIGYGFTDPDIIKDYSNKSMSIEDADEILRYKEIPFYIDELRKRTPNFDKLNQNQKDALFSLIYNIGGTNYSNSKKLLEYLSKGDYVNAAEEINHGVTSKVHGKGLSKRRKYEQDLFLKPLSYEDYLNGLPVYLRNSTDYNLEEAYKNNMTPKLRGSTYELDTINPETEELMLLPYSRSTLSTIAREQNAGNIIINKGGKTYSKPSPLPEFKSFGGSLHTNGGIFSDGVIEINSGGTHEENPNEGVQMGIDAQGIPNLVEEGEVIFNDYVFSNRMTVPKENRKQLGLGIKDKELTFAKAAKKLSKEAEERPNDPISSNGLEDALGKLAFMQEKERMDINTNKYSKGGKLSKKFAGLGDYPNILFSPEQTDPYAFFGNEGRNRVTNQRIARGWDSFTDNNGVPLYNTETNAYNPDYLDSRFQAWLRTNYNRLSDDWWNTSNAPDYFKAGNTSAPTIDQMLGNIEEPGLMYDKKYGEAHDFGRYAYNLYRNSLKPSNQEVAPPTIGRINTQAPKSEEGQETPDKLRYPTWMRYAPIVASGVGVFTDALGLTNKPDYSNADAILNATYNRGNYMPVAANPIGNYLTYRPFDRNYYTNKLNAQSGATRRAIVNQSAGNRATALAGLLAADYNAQGRLGDLYRQAEEYNQNQRERIASFNRGTNQFNSEMGLRAAIANQNALAQLRNYQLRGALSAAEMRENARRYADANRSANLTNFIQGLGDIGAENVAWNQMQWADEHDVFGPHNDRIAKGYRRKNGGKLLTKRK